MSKLIVVSQELFEMRNMSSFLRRNFKVDSKEPITVTDVHNSIRISASLQRKLFDFLEHNTHLGVFSLLSKVNIQNINNSLSFIIKRYSADEAINLSDQQKQYLTNAIEAVVRGIKNMAGRVYFSLEETDSLKNLSTDIQEFLIECRDFHIKTSSERSEEFEKNERREKEIAKAKVNASKKGKKVSVEELASIELKFEEDDDDDLILGTKSQPKKIISASIDE